MEDYQLHNMASLAAQILRGPRRLRLRQLHNIEFLLSVIETSRDYPYDFVCHALTGYRTRNGDDDSRLLPADELVGDLVTLAEQLSEDADLTIANWSDRVFSANELSQRFDVSTKTIFRWRKRGLAGWKFRFPDRRKRLLFTDHSVRRFVAQNTGLVARGSNFSQLSKAERTRIIEMARALVEGGERTVNAAAKTISEQTGRAVETIRLILKHYDEAHPRRGLFNRTPLQVDVDDKRLAIWEAYVEGATVKQLAKRFRKSIAWMYATITALRGRELKGRRIDYVPSDEFELEDADDLILKTQPEEPLYQELSDENGRRPGGLPSYLVQLFYIPLLTVTGEATLFRRMNYLKYKADQERKLIDPDKVKAKELDRIEELLIDAAKLKNELVQANLRLVVSIAKKHLRPNQDLFELISDGNIALMRAVDKFDYSRGFKFSTYGSWAIMRSFTRLIPERHQHNERYQTGWDELLESMAYVGPDEFESDYLATLRAAVDGMLETLDEREGDILRHRYGLDSRGQPQTLEQVGRRFGVSKERIRQLEGRAMNKLRTDFSQTAERLFGN